MSIKRQKQVILIFLFFSLATGLLPKNSFSEAPQLHTIPPSLVSVKPVPPDKPVRPGESFTLTLELTVAPGYHINSEKPEDELLIPTSIEIKKETIFEVKEIIFPEARKKKFKFSNQPLAVYEGQIKIEIKLDLADDICGTSLELEGKVRYQACDEEACLRPASVPFKAVIKIAT